MSAKGKMPFMARASRAIAMLAGFGPQDAALGTFPNSGYEASSSRGPRTANWWPQRVGPNASMLSLNTLRARAREKRRNDGLANTVIEVLTSNMIGSGIRPQFKTTDAGLNKDLAGLWSDWTGECDADEQCDFYGLQALAFSSMLEGGDCFGRLRVRRLDDGLTVPMQIQLLEGEYCPTEWNRMLDANTYIQQGVEFGPTGTHPSGRRAYWLWQWHPQDWTARAVLATNFQPVRVSADDVMHLCQPRRPGQIRGEPWLTRMLIKLHDLDEYDDAQLVRQKIAAMFAGFVKNSPPKGIFGDSVNGTVGFPDNSNGNVTYPSLEPGTMQDLQSGEEIEWSDPPTPGESYEAYMRHQERRLATSGGILYEQLTGDYAAGNDRTYRAAVNEFRRRIMGMTGQFNFRWNQPSMNRWVDLAIASGAVKLPKGIDAKAIKRVHWAPQAFDYLNPTQDVQAKRDEIRAGLKPRSVMISEDGRDPMETDQIFEDDNKRADDKKLVFDTDPRYTNNKGAAQQTPGEIEPGDTPTGDEIDPPATPARQPAAAPTKKPKRA